MSGLGSALLTNRNGHKREQERKAAEERARKARARQEDIATVQTALASAQVKLTGQILSGEHDPVYSVSRDAVRLLREHSLAFRNEWGHGRTPALHVAERFSEIEQEWQKFCVWARENGIKVNLVDAHDGMGMESWNEFRVDVL